jgi:PAS domain S-box-containing protein
METVHEDEPGPASARPAAAEAVTDHEQGERSAAREMIDALAFRALAEASPGLVWRLGPDGCFTYVSARCLEYCGRTPEQVIGRRWDELIHPDDRPAYVASIAAAQHDRDRVMASARLEDGQGQWRWIESHAHPLIDAAGEYVGHAGISFDVTERRQASDDSARLAAVVEWSDDAIVSKDLNGVIMSWNAGARRLFGYSADEVIGQSVTMLIPPERFDEEPGVLERIRRGQSVDHYETVRRRKDGTLIDVSLTVSPIRNRQGQVIGASKIARDVTDSKRVAEMLRTANRRKDEFLAVLAHELRNPLAPIVVSLENLRRLRTRTEAGGAGTPRDASQPAESDLAHRIDSALDVLQRQVGHMVRLVDDLLDAGRISRGKIELRREHVELASVIDHVVDAARLLCESRGQTLTSLLPPEPVYLDADPTRLAQVVGNLLNNASKFTDRGGRIWLTVEREDSTEPAAPDAGVEPAPHVVIRVRDTGVGIARDQLPRVFEMFTQLDTSLERSLGGLGIGLTLVKTLTEQHGGSVHVRSAGIGHGSEFVVRLPIAAAAAAPQPTVPAVPEAAVPLTVLVVDDNHDAAEMLAMLLSMAGHDPHTVHDGAAAVEATARLRPDVLLMDIGLPGLNGYEAARLIRGRQDEGPRPVLVAVTGWGQEQDRRRSEEAGFDAHVVKPVDAVALGHLLAEIGARKLEQQH